jgi:uncharacterized protein (TIGR02996 family)
MAKKKAAPQERAFLDDICARPEDDAPRLVYADWLDDHDQAHRTEFIRLQCQLAALAEHDPRWQELEEREWELLTVHGPQWRDGLPAWAKKEEHTFRRGFVERISITTTNFLARGAALFAVAPIRDLHLRSLNGRLPEVVASPLMRGLESLDLQGNHLLPDELRALTRSPHLTGLTSLSLRDTHLEVDGMCALDGWKQLSRIRRLDVSRNGASAVTALVNQRQLNGLTWLNLDGCHPNAGVLRRLATGKRMAGLTHLDLSNNRLDPYSAEALTAEGSLSNLTSLVLRGYVLTEEVREALARSALLPQLESLSLLHLGVDAATLRILGAGDRFARLRRLDLQWNSFNDEAAEALAATQVNSLTRLDLSWNHFGDAGILALAASPHLRNLTWLSLTDGDIGPAGAKAIATSPSFSRLRYLSLASNPIGSEGVQALAASPHLTNLRTLDLMYTGVDDAALRSLARSPYLGNLRSLNLVGYYNADDRALRELANSPRLPRLLVLKVQVVMFDSPEELQKLGRTIVV